jgi:phosphatidylglycerophosphatase A
MKRSNLSPSTLIATGFGSGLCPVSPGTMGSAAAVLLWWLLIFFLKLSPPFSAAIILGFSLLAGTLATASALKSSRAKDPGFVVIDEWAGMSLLLLIAAPSTNLQILMAFVLFRLFDIIKPGPVRWAESLPGAFGVMADDLVAALLGALVFVGLATALPNVI